MKPTRCVIGLARSAKIPLYVCGVVTMSFNIQLIRPNVGPRLSGGDFPVNRNSRQGTPAMAYVVFVQFCIVQTSWNILSRCICPFSPYAVCAGSIPKQFGNLRALRNLSLAYNNISGEYSVLLSMAPTAWLIPVYIV